MAITNRTIFAEKIGALGYEYTSQQIDNDGEG